jgi:hypothetical protein
MKNLYIIPTDKPSRLRYTYGYNYALSRERLSWRFANHIYIVSDEDIKEGDYCLFLETNTVFKMHKHGLPASNRNKKIILTTDQDLIADGVQAIDDIFLEWFVMNPKRDKVNVDKLQMSNGESRYIIINYTVKEDTTVHGVNGVLNEIEKNFFIKLRNKK